MDTIFATSKKMIARYTINTRRNNHRIINDHFMSIDMFTYAQQLYHTTSATIAQFQVDSNISIEYDPNGVDQLQL